MQRLTQPTRTTHRRGGTILCASSLLILPLSLLIPTHASPPLTTLMPTTPQHSHGDEDSTGPAGPGALIIITCSRGILSVSLDLSPPHPTSSLCLGPCPRVATVPFTVPLSVPRRYACYSALHVLLFILAFPPSLEPSSSCRCNTFQSWKALCLTHFPPLLPIPPQPTASSPRLASAGAAADHRPLWSCPSSILSSSSPARNTSRPKAGVIR